MSGGKQGRTEAPEHNSGRTTDKERLDRFFAERHVRSDCPLCNTSAWIIQETAGRGTNLILLADWSAGVPVYLLVCKNCGFTRPHFAGVVDKTFTPDDDTTAGPAER